MLSIKTRPSNSAAISAVLIPAVMLLVGSCRNAAPEGGSSVDLTPFQAMARAASCADVRNRLFLIDDRLVFWDRAGSCLDNLYSLNLYGSSAQAVLCYRVDAIGGGNVTTCPDDRYRGMFETMIVSLDDPTLGIGPDHTVQAIAF